MNELIKPRMKKSIGKDVTIFLLNNFRYTGKVTNIDDKYVELLDFKTDSYKLILLNDIKFVDFPQETEVSKND